MKQCPKCNAQYSKDQAMCPIDASVLVDLDAKEGQTNVDPMIGRLIADKYRIEKLLGRGGMGAVYEGQHLLLDRRVAIKVLQQNMANDEQAASRFIREAKASARIEHPNAVTIFDFGVLQEGSAYLVMEFIRGYSLRQLLMRRENLKAEQIVEWMIQVCNVVEAAHQQGIIHRDLKPENVMLKESPDGSITVKVVDFGLAKLVSDTGPDKASAHLTRPGEMLGTPHYMAPEYYEGEAIDKRADIYAIGIMMYELFCGDTPFTGTVQSIIGGHLFKDPQPIISFNPSVYPAIDEVVQKALKKKRDERIASAVELAQELRQALKKAKDFFLQQTVSQMEPFVDSENSSDTKQSEEHFLKTEKVFPSGSRETSKVSKEGSVLAGRPTQQMTLGTMQVSQDMVDELKEGFQEELLEGKQSDSSFTSATTKPQPEILKPPIIPPTVALPSPVAQDTLPATQTVPPTSAFSTVVPPTNIANANAQENNSPREQLSTNQSPSTSGQLNLEYETFSEALAAIKGQLLVGSIIVALLAIMVTLLIIYRLEFS